MTTTVSRLEKLVTAACIVIGGCVAAFLAPSGEYFSPNFTFFWGSQIFVLLPSLFLRPRPAIVAGISLSMAIYLAMFHAWSYPDGMAWVLYGFSLPGTAIGAFLGTYSVIKRSSASPVAAGASAAAYASLAIAVNLALVLASA